MTNSLDILIGPQEFFRDKITTAASDMNITLDAQVEFYLVNLMCDFVSPNKLGRDFFSKPLAFMLKEALESESNQRLRILKEMGDTSLYVAGYFGDYFNRKVVDIDYFIAMGAEAYARLADLFYEKHNDANFQEMYDRLAKRFNILVDVLAFVSEDSPIVSDATLLDKYDRWTKTQSEFLRRQLEDAGIVPLDTDLRKSQ